MTGPDSPHGGPGVASGAHDSRLGADRGAHLPADGDNAMAGSAAISASPGVYDGGCGAGRGAPPDADGGHDMTGSAALGVSPGTYDRGCGASGEIDPILVN